ncbi:MAG TPA: alpha/beta hydrolase [Cyclobacteriaceae bacterium]|nr:alpha/beta hydrolase [Cyclobacteriaceae bacterium]
MEKVITTLIGAYLNALSLISPRKAGEHGVNVFCYPVRPTLKSYHKDFLNSSERFEFHFQGLRLQAYRWGGGKRRVLFLHGWQSHTFRWKNYIQSLSPDEFTVYAFDAPGHGFSDGKFLSVPFYSEAIQHFVNQVGEFETAVAHSVGSFSLVYTLYRVPQIPIRQIVLMAPPGEASDFIDFFAGRLKLSNRAIQITLDHFKYRFGKPVSYFSTARFAESLKVPGLIIHDENDEETPYHYARKINEGWERAQLITTRGLGHNLKSPDVVTIVCNFARGVFTKESIDRKNKFILQLS